MPLIQLIDAFLPAIWFTHFLLRQYYDETFATVKEQKAFERNLFNKTHRNPSEVIMLDGLTCVYRSNVDLFFYVMGNSNENGVRLDPLREKQTISLNAFQPLGSTAHPQQCPHLSVRFNQPNLAQKCGKTLSNRQFGRHHFGHRWNLWWRVRNNDWPKFGKFEDFISFLSPSESSWKPIQWLSCNEWPWKETTFR